jgi:hypothetical protein
LTGSGFGALFTQIVNTGKCWGWHVTGVFRTLPTTLGTFSSRVIKASTAAFTRMSAASSVNEDRSRRGAQEGRRERQEGGRCQTNVAASASPSHDYGLWIDAYTGYVRFALLNVNMRSTVCLSTKGTDSISMRRNNRGRRMGTCIRVPLG